jgi:hypothetical protein
MLLYKMTYFQSPTTHGILQISTFDCYMCDLHVMNHTYHLPLFLVFHTNLSYITLCVATSRYDEYNW